MWIRVGRLSLLVVTSLYLFAFLYRGVLYYMIEFLPSLLHNAPPSFRDGGMWEQGNIIRVCVETPLKILGNVMGNLEVLNIGDPI